LRTGFATLFVRVEQARRPRWSFEVERTQMLWKDEVCHLLLLASYKQVMPIP
jgi:hypothetical protein